MQEFITIPTYLVRELPPDKLYALLDILSMANENGEVHMSVRQFMNRWKWGNTKVVNFVNFLEQQDIFKTETRHRQDGKQNTVLMINAGFANSYQDSRQDADKTQTRRRQDAEESKDFHAKINREDAKQRIVDTWNELSPYGIEPISVESISRRQWQGIVHIAEEYGVEDILKAIQRIKNSDFLQGKSERGWKISFNWFLNMEKYEKVRSGEYDGRINRGYENKTAQMLEQHYDMMAEFVKEMEEKENEYKGI